MKVWRSVNTFDIEVGVHLLAYTAPDLELNATVRANITFNGLVGSVEIDEQVAKTADIVSITAQTPPWLVFDNWTLIFSGTVPADATPYSITVQAVDIYGDEASTQILLDVSTVIFSKKIGVFNVTTGSVFSFDLGPYLINKSDVAMTTQFSPSESWQSFESEGFIVSGDVPSNTTLSTIEVVLGQPRNRQRPRALNRSH